MELSFNDIKKLQVINLNDGKNLGKVCNIIFFYPENTIKGFVATGGKCFRFSREEQFIPLSEVVRIGEDVIITDVELAPPGEKPRCRKKGKGMAPAEMCGPSHGQRRSYDEYE